MHCTHLKIWFETSHCVSVLGKGLSVFKDNEPLLVVPRFVPRHVEPDFLDANYSRCTAMHGSPSW